MNKPIAFIDSEVDMHSRKITDLGAVKDHGAVYHGTSVMEFMEFLKGCSYICGHNIINHDLKFLARAVTEAGIPKDNYIDTLYFSPLLFPARPYHALVKDDKLQSDDINNPFTDALKAKDLFYDEAAAFDQCDDLLKQIYYLLLGSRREFGAFFRYLGYRSMQEQVQVLIAMQFYGEICEHAPLEKLSADYPVELAYCLSLINSHNRYSITPPWVLKNYPQTEKVMRLLRHKPCLTGCVYCNKALDVHLGLKTFFGFDGYRSYGGQPLQEKAVKAAIDDKSMMVVFPTGGGKSITFQVPALMSAVATKGLTVVISPLQSLMKDQVDNLERLGITEAVTINGMLDPIERAKSFERVEDGTASLLYISPESLRSKTIERLLLGRKVSRFVIDEAHCFSSWGQDFRVDYLYIGDFIKQLQEKKNLAEPIPVSCFTATAKRKVIEDITQYFREKLSLNLELFSSTSSRDNLYYKVIEKDNEEEKYRTVRQLLESRDCPAIIYVSRTRKAYLLAERLRKDGFSVKPYHGKMDSKEKSEYQNAFIEGDIRIIVATSAFGMGVDKKDVGMVIHYEICDSLENYIQEAGRAGRDENITAECYVLYNEEDLSKHFILLNQTRLTLAEIQQVWKAIKDITRFRSTVSNSALEIARKAGWDENVMEIETRVITAIAALEDAGYLKRGQNIPRIFASSILAKTAQEAIDKIALSDRFNEHQKEKGIRIIKKLISSKSRKQAADEKGEARVDYIADHLGIVREEVINIINLLREENILADAKDLTAYIRKNEKVNHSLEVVQLYGRIELFLLPYLDQTERTFNLKEFNEAAGLKAIEATPMRIQSLLNFWGIKNWIKKKRLDKNHVTVCLNQSRDIIRNKLLKRHELATFIIEYLYEKSHSLDAEPNQKEFLVEFSVHELQQMYRTSMMLIHQNITIEDIEDALFYLSRIEALKIEGGFLVVYNRLTIDRLELDNKKRYKSEDYQKLSSFYDNKIQQIHIVGEYAKKMIDDYHGALQFVDDYFQLNYPSFLNKYFPGSRQKDIRQNLTPAKFRQLFGSLSPTQLEIIKDNRSSGIAVLAGPGSGKTKVLVHKLASLLLMEDIKHEQLLMVTFSRAAASEFRKRLIGLIGNAALYVDIKTFHSYCFDLLGKIGSIEKSAEVIKLALEKIRKGEVEVSSITRTVLVVDEAQDMDEDEYTLVLELIKRNENIRVIMVGDDDQNIFEFRGSSARYMEEFIKQKKAVTHELIENFRSKNNLVVFTNSFAGQICHRLKKSPIVSAHATNGTIRIVSYLHNNLITPLVNDILSAELSGTTCILTRTNEEAEQVTGLLVHHNIGARLIQSNDDFNLYNLAEIRFFVNTLKNQGETIVISDEVWLKAIEALQEQFSTSSRIDLCLNLIREFENIYPKKKYQTDLEVFIRESKLEDFFAFNSDTIFVSTMHKAKGKEFDNIYIMLENYQPSSDEAKRALYVAMTRAKNNLVIHYNGRYLDRLFAEDIIKTTDTSQYEPPEQLAMHLSHKHVWLDYFSGRQNIISALRSGDTLRVSDDTGLNEKGQKVLKFSRHFLDLVEARKKEGYTLGGVKVNFIVYWKKEDAPQEIKVVLPEVIFKKTG